MEMNALVDAINRAEDSFERCMLAGSRVQRRQTNRSSASPGITDNDRMHAIEQMARLSSAGGQHQGRQGDNSAGCWAIRWRG